MAKKVKEFLLILLPVTIFIGYPIYMHVLVWGRGADEHLWNPYIFCGMPSYALSTGYPWWNLVGVLFSTFRDVVLHNPIGMVLFAGSVWWLLKKENKLRYGLMILMEFNMLYFAYWSCG